MRIGRILLTGLLLAISVPLCAQEKPLARCGATFSVERTNEISQHLDAELRRNGYQVVEKVEDSDYALRVVPDSKATSMTPGGTIILVNRSSGKVVWEKRRRNWWWMSSPKRTAEKLVKSLRDELGCP